MTTPISKTQERLLAILNLTAADYDSAAATLTAAGFRRDAIPFGENWRTAKKLSDADLVDRCRESEPKFNVHNVHENNY